MCATCCFYNVLRHHVCYVLHVLRRAVLHHAKLCYVILSYVTCTAAVEMVDWLCTGDDVA